jgi:hypothetical protein
MMEGMAAASIAYNQVHTSTRLAAQAAKRATESATCRRSQEVWSIVLMAKTSDDSTLGVLGIIFFGFFGGFRTRLRLRDISPKGAPAQKALGCPVPDAMAGSTAATQNRLPRWVISERFPAKWVPVRVKKTRQNKE